ncbi:MAG: Crp/Fnr family transcriptional regulator [Spirochaetales bacterium]|nr:Crp/Fnr family transcriptional regulator [Spirochaetales bacterium]
MKESSISYEVLNEYIEHLDVLSEEEKQLLVENTKYGALEKGEMLNCNDRHKKIVFIVTKGRVKISMATQKQKAITLWWVFERETCVIGAVNGITFTSSKVCSLADCDSEIIIINGDVYRDVFNNHKETVTYFESQIGERMTDLLWLVEKIAFSNTENRLVNYLVEKISQENNTLITVTQDEIALDLGVGRVIISRMIRLMTEKGILRSSRGSLKVLDYNKLLNWSE